MVNDGWLMDGFYNTIYLVGGFNPSAKIMEFVKWDYDIPYGQKCSKPPIREVLQDVTDIKV